MTTLSIETRQLYHQIRQDVVSLHYQLSILLSLYRGGPHDTEVLEKIAGTFFHRVLYNDLTDAIVLNLARLLDPAEQRGNCNASLAMLISEIEHIEPKLAEQLKAHRNSLNPYRSDFDLWRNKWAAHRDYNTMIVQQTPTLLRTPSQHEIRPHFNPEELKHALKELDSFMNLFESAFEDKIVVNPTNPIIPHVLIPSPTQYEVFDATDEIKKLIKAIDAVE